MYRGRGSDLCQGRHGNSCTKKFVERFRYLIRPQRFDNAVHLAERYWREAFTGRRFYELWDASRPDEITARDVVAVSTLGVTVPPAVAIWLLNDEGARATRALLDQIPTDRDIWDADDLLERGRAAWDLWDVLETACWPEKRRGNGMGSTTISKLLATKRPRLVPIWDSVVRSLFPPVQNYWEAFRCALGDESLIRGRLAMGT